jgi:hypothetical protein
VCVTALSNLLDMSTIFVHYESIRAESVIDVLTSFVYGSGGISGGQNV